MKSISTGAGLAFLGASVFASVLIANPRFGSNAEASSTNVAQQIVAAATAQTDPTVVWYGTQSVAVSIFSETSMNLALIRAWSNGRVEMKFLQKQVSRYNQNPYSVFCNEGINCATGWTVVSDPNLGYTAAADIDLSGQVDSGDISMALLNFGPAPRNDVPPSDCPLNLINP